jgi:hypothetical protein
MNFELSILIKTTVILAFGCLAIAILHRASASTRHGLWAIALFNALLLPSASIVLPPLPVPRASRKRDVEARDRSTQQLRTRTAATPFTARVHVPNPHQRQWLRNLRRVHTSTSHHIDLGGRLPGNAYPSGSGNVVCTPAGTPLIDRYGSGFECIEGPVAARARYFETGTDSNGGANAANDLGNLPAHHSPSGIR